MKSISHLSKEEQQHFIKCECGEFMDMRDLGEVFKHFHIKAPAAQWSHSKKIGEPAAYTRSGSRLDLN